MFSLKRLLDFENTTIQCHDYPDADTLASAYAVYTYLKDKGKQPKIIYSGRAKITKPNLLNMTELLSIPANHAETLPSTEALVMVDCQHNESNATKFNAPYVFQIDHHEDKEKPYEGIVRSNLGSCSTLVWDLLKKENFTFEKHPNVATALYYGLYTDTNSFEEISHPLDKDMRDELFYDKVIINTLRFNNLSVEELAIAGRALLRHKIDRANSFAIFQADECDQNILGFISDLAMQVEGVNTCIVFTRLPNGYKLSVRSCTREVMASEIAAFLASGGGHKQKAGGFISHDEIGDLSISQYIGKRAEEYFGSYDTVYANNHSLNVLKMPRYSKRRIPIGCVLSTDIFSKGTPMLIRTMEGDEDFYASDDILLMIGSQGEVYPINADKFAKSYALVEEGFIRDYQYSPTAKNKLTGESFQIVTRARACIPVGSTYIHAAQLQRNTKVFTKWNSEGYMLGVTGDYIAVRSDDHNDVYVIKEEIFKETYTII